MMERNLEASDTNIEILKTTIENMGNELFLYKSENDKQREKAQRL